MNWNLEYYHGSNDHEYAKVRARVTQSGLFYLDSIQQYGNERLLLLLWLM